MGQYEELTKDELIQRIKELETTVEVLKKNPNIGTPNELRDFKEMHGREILDSLPDMLSVFDLNYDFLALASAEKTVHVGGSAENLLEKNLSDILPPDAYNSVKENFDRVVSSKQSSIGYHSLIVDGHREHFENRVIPLKDNKLLCVCRNISESVEAQNQLDMIISAVNNSIEEIYATHLDGSLIFANKQFISHYEVEGDIRQYKIFNIHQKVSRQDWEKHVKRLKNAGGTLKYTSTHERPDGKRIPNEISAYILKDKAEEEIIWSLVHDISERVEQEKQIHELNQLMNTILNTIPVYLFVKDCGDDFKYIYWNKALEEKSHIPASEVLGRTDMEIFPNPDDAQKFKEDDLQLLKGRHPISFEEEYESAIGERRTVHTTKTFVIPKGKAPLLLGISWDITEQKNTEKELIRARNKAEESDRLKSAFLANMSHEIRTPLNAIVGFSRFLAEIDEPEERRQYFDIVDKNTELLLQLINDILDLSKIEAGILEFSKRKIDLNELCQGMYETHLSRTPKNVNLVFDSFPERITTISDSNRLAQVISNLLTNAQKFTKEGEIRFGFTPKNGWIEFHIKDTGMGIPEKDIDKVFNRFVKLNNFIHGTGLGLSICQMIIENLGGHIWVESQEGTGTTFYFTVPHLEVEESEKQVLRPKVAPIPGKDRKTILVAEDVDSNFLLIKTLIGKEYTLIHAHNGKEAIRLFEEKSPDLILMDIKMPEMDGMEATKIIRTLSADIPIIAQTAFAFESDKEAAYKAGCSDFLAKPISEKELKKTLGKYL